MESVAGFYAAVDEFGLPAVTSACELLQLDRLVRRYPAAARKALALHRPAPDHTGAVPNWTRTGDINGLPLWRWTGGRPVYLATGDTDQLRYVGVALSRFDAMTAEELRAYLANSSRSRAAPARVPLVARERSCVLRRRTSLPPEVTVVATMAV